MNIVISAFPGTGKSFAYKKFSSEEHNFEIFDSDSSKFDKANFPQNYISHIKNLLDGDNKLILVSSHKEVREALVEADIWFLLFYPSKDPITKSIYLDRYKRRGSDEKFIKLISDNWDSWIDDCKSQKRCKKIEMNGNEYISDFI